MMEKEHLMKLIIQHLNNKGYKEVSEKLEQEADISIDSPELNKFLACLSLGEFDNAIEILLKKCGDYERISIIPKIRICQIFEMLKSEKAKSNTIAILEFIRKIVSLDFLYEKDPIIDKCSSLVFIQDKQILYNKMAEFCPSANSREALIDYSKLILHKSKSILRTLYPSSLENMLDSVMKTQIRQCKYHNTSDKKFSYFEDHKCKMEVTPTKLLCSIEKHNAEVLNVVMSNTLNLFAVALKTNEVAIYQLSSTDLKKNYMTGLNGINIDSSNAKADKYNVEIHLINVFMAHKDQITCLEWNKNDSILLTASKDKTIKTWNPLKTTTPLQVFEKHENMITSAVWCDNDSKICSAGLDHKVILWNTNGTIIESFPTATISEIIYSHKYNVILLVATTSNSILIFDIKTKTEIDKLVMNDTIISIAISKLDNGGMLLVNSSKSAPTLNLWDLKKRKIERKYFGHRQDRLTIRCGFGGENENFLVCGSDDAKINVWSRYHSIPIFEVKYHSASVNAIIWPCKFFNKVLISVSDDHTIKVLGNYEVKKVNFYDNTLKIEKKSFLIEENFDSMNYDEDKEILSRSQVSRDRDSEEDS